MSVSAPTTDRTTYDIRLLEFLAAVTGPPEVIEALHGLAPRTPRWAQGRSTAPSTAFRIQTDAPT